MEVLEHYDVHQLFIAQDIVGTSYLCLTYDCDDAGVLQCLAVSISKGRLNDFLTGHIDLRQIFIHPEQNAFDVFVDSEIVTANLRQDAPEEDMLPDEGYYVDYSHQENHEMICASREEGRTIVRFAFNFDTNNHTIPLDVLAGTIHDFQSIMTKVCRRLYRNEEGNDAHLLARAQMAASFDMEFMSEEVSNLFGHSKVSDTLGMILPLFSNDDEVVAGRLSFFKDIQSNYRSFVKQLSDSEISFKYKWVDSSVESIVEECKVLRERTSNLYSLASRLEQLEDREVNLDGRFFMANTKNGSWGFIPSLEARQKKGVCFNKELLNGIVLNNQRYRITCTVQSSRNPNTGKDYTSYVLTNVDRLLEA